MAMLVITRGYIIFVQLWPWNEQSLITSHLPMVEISQNYCPFLGYPISIDIQWMPCSKNVHPSRVCDFFWSGLLSQKKAEKDWFSLEMMRENILLNHHWITILDLFWALLYSIHSISHERENLQPWATKLAKDGPLWLSLPYAPWCCYIYPHHWLIFGVNVGRYSSDMEDLSMFIDIHLQLVTF